VVLNPEQIEHFVDRGYVRLEAAFSPELAARCRALLWEQMAPLAPDDPAMWDRPVVRLPSQLAPPFREAVTSPRWLTAIAELAGPKALAHPHLAGTVAVRFPVAGDSGDDGWHIDTSIERDGVWWANHRSDERALLMLVLFSDVGPDDAPTRVRAGSHHDIARALAWFGEGGLAPDGLGPFVGATSDRPVELATGQAGDVVLCHPFLVHAAQAHHGTEPRFLAQPGVLLTESYTPADRYPVTAPFVWPPDRA
jgi:hypothetical protein